MTTATTEGGTFGTPPDARYGIPEAPADPRDTQPRTGTTTPGPSTNLSVEAFIQRFFGDAFGGALKDEVVAGYKKWLAGYDITQVLFDIRQSEAYNTRFAGMRALRDKGRSISEAAYLDLERQYVQVARQFDLPPGFYDSPDDFGRWIGQEVSPLELKDRLTVWQVWERETRSSRVSEEELRRFAEAGMAPSDGDFLAGVLDPDRALTAIERRVTAGIASAAAARSGFGSLSIEEGLSLADRGVTREQAEQGFGALTDASELFTALPGEAADAIGRNEQLGAAFLGDSAARRRIERRGRARTAEFGGGGGGNLGSGGLAGLGGG